MHFLSCIYFYYKDDIFPAKCRQSLGVVTRGGTIGIGSFFNVRAFEWVFIVLEHFRGHFGLFAPLFFLVLSFGLAFFNYMGNFEPIAFFFFCNLSFLFFFSNFMGWEGTHVTGHRKNLSHTATPF